MIHDMNLPSRPPCTLRLISSYLFAALLVAGCKAGGPANDSTMKNNLGSMRTADITVAGKFPYKVWLARTNDEQEKGLMNTSLDELPADHGMLFVFDRDKEQSFWM